MPEESSSFRRSRPDALLLLLIVVLCGAFLRITLLSHEALEGDEIFSLHVVLMPPLQELAAIRADLVHPPLYYFLLQATAKIWGASAYGIRVLSLLCGILSIPLVWLIGRGLPGQRVTALLAAALLALNQSHIFYSQEARSYAWYTLLTMAFVLWMIRITATPERIVTIGDWVAAALLMILLVYTHYVGAIYVASAVLAVLLARTSRGQKVGVFLCALFAALTFLPWLAAIAGVYHQKQGVGENLDWQGHPDLYALKQVLASSLGIPSFHGSTTLVLLVIALLGLAAILLTPRHIANSPAPVILLCLGILPPVIVFILSRPPINLPLFGLRHFLPSIPCMILLCSYGLDRLAQKAMTYRAAATAFGAVVLLLIAAVPTMQNLRSRPSRIPYDVVSHAVMLDHAEGMPAYATWFYGVGEPVNFYCATQCVNPLPEADAALPSKFVLLFRPRSSSDTQRLEQLQHEGFSEIQQQYYTDGGHSIYGTTLAVLQRSQPENSTGVATAGH